jgi:hypothetical protein
VQAACETGEQSAEAAYAEAAEANPTGQTHTLIEKHRQQISGFCPRLSKLVGESKMASNSRTMNKLLAVQVAGSRPAESESFENKQC